MHGIMHAHDKNNSTIGALKLVGTWPSLYIHFFISKEKDGQVQTICIMFLVELFLALIYV